MTAFKPHLQKSLNPFSVWAIALGTILGFGAFVLPGFWLAEAGPMGTALGILLGGLMMLVIARSFGFMVRRFPVAGGEFVFAYRGFGRTHAFVCGWFLAVGYLSIVPLNATALPILGSF
ncbi:MAG: amino acid permease, partial [Anaerolineae bacterium]